MVVAPESAPDDEPPPNAPSIPFSLLWKRTARIVITAKVIWVVGEVKNENIYAHDSMATQICQLIGAVLGDRYVLYL